MRLIDADAMMKHLENLLCGDCDTPRKEGWCDVCDYAFLMSEMKKEPTVEPKHGHWVDEGEKFLPIYCSCCGFGKKHEDQRSYTYCPNCGCKMDEVEDV